MIEKKPFVLSLSKDARIVPFDSPFVLRFSKDERRLRTGFGYVLRFKKFTRSDSKRYGLRSRNLLLKTVDHFHGSRVPPGMGH
jgi:hypothetical protein